MCVFLAFFFLTYQKTSQDAQSLSTVLKIPSPCALGERCQILLMWLFWKTQRRVCLAGTTDGEASRIHTQLRVSTIGCEWGLPQPYPGENNKVVYYIVNRQHWSTREEKRRLSQLQRLCGVRLSCLQISLHVQRAFLGNLFVLQSWRCGEKTWF